MTGAPLDLATLRRLLGPQVTVTQRDDLFDATLPITDSNGDYITVWIVPMGEGWQISDGGTVGGIVMMTGERLTEYIAEHLPHLNNGRVRYNQDIGGIDIVISDRSEVPRWVWHVGDFVKTLTVSIDVRRRIGVH